MNSIEREEEETSEVTYDTKPASYDDLYPSVEEVGYEEKTTKEKLTTSFTRESLNKKPVTTGKYNAKLYASNGQLMLATEEVSLEKSAKNAIESVKKYAEQGNFIIDRDKFGRFYYKLRNAQKSVICIGEAYDTLDSCVSAIESVRRFSLTAIFSAE